MNFEVLQKILPHNIVCALLRLRLDKLCEVRLRSDRAVTVLYDGAYNYLSVEGVTDTVSRAITLDAESLGQVVMRACNKSMYVYNDCICQGYLTLEGGIRLGIAGETVFEGGQIRTVKNFAALNIRLPHEVIGCATKIMPHIKCSCGYYSTLIVSPPGAGKTTLLRDMARIIGSEQPICNILIVDERDEIAAAQNGKPTLQVGQNTDVISRSTKEFAFIRGIRALRPDYILTDELCGAQDVAAVETAISGGVGVFASVHAENLQHVSQKPSFYKLLQNRYFHRFILISAKRGPGTIEGIYDENMQPIDNRGAA